MEGRMNKYPHHLFLRGKSWYFQRKGKIQALHTTDKQEAIAKRDVLMKEIDYHGMDEVFKVVPLFGDVCVEWWNYKKQILTRPVSQDRYKYYLNSIILKTPFVGKKVDKITEDDIEAWIYGTILKTASANTALIYLTVLSNIFKFAMRKRYVIYNPVSTVHRPKYVRPTPDPFNMDEVQAIIGVSPALYRNFLVVKFFSGLRISELCGLMWNDIDLVNNTISVRRSMLNRVVDDVKNAYSRRDVHMLPAVKDAIIAQRDITLGRSEYVFVDETMLPIHDNRFSKRVWQDLLKKAGVRYRCFRKSRQSFITQSIEAGASLSTVSKMVGHCDNSMIWKHYQKLLDKPEDYVLMSNVLHVPTTQDDNTLKVLDGTSK
jgi:integrase